MLRDFQNQEYQFTILKAIAKRYTFHVNATERIRSTRTQAIVKRYAFHANAKMSHFRKRRAIM